MPNIPRTVRDCWLSAQSMAICRANGRAMTRPARSVTVNLAESPLGWLFARGHVSQRQFDAGERLRADWERGQLGQRVTMAWDAAPVARTRGGSAQPVDLSGSQLDARRRFEAAVAEAGTGLSDILWRVVCAGEGMREAETRARLARTGRKDRASDRARPGRGLLPDPLVLRLQPKSDRSRAMILYGSTMSPFVRKVAAYAAEKGIELELQQTGFPNHTPEFCAASPFKKMPALADGDYLLSDSSAIIHYLEAKYPEPELIPAEPRGAWPGDLVRRICRYAAVRVRREDLLQQGGGAALPGPRGRSCRRPRQPSATSFRRCSTIWKA